MSAETLERLQCLKNWIRQGGVKLVATVAGRGELEWEMEGSVGRNRGWHMKYLNKSFKQQIWDGGGSNISNITSD